MNSRDNQQVADIVKAFLPRYGGEIYQKISVDKDPDNDAVHIKTLFGEPHLDVNIEVNGGEFVASYSNDNYSEHWFKPDVKPTEIADKICQILQHLIEHGAEQIDYTVKGLVYKSVTRVGDVDIATDIKKVNPFILKKKHYKKFPPVL